MFTDESPDMILDFFSIYYTRPANAKMSLGNSSDLTFMTCPIQEIRGCNLNSILISQPKHMLWLIKRTVSVSSQTHVSTDG